MDGIKLTGYGPARETALHEHGLLALMDLSHMLSSIFDERQLVSTAMLSVMGHVGATAAGVWLLDGPSPHSLHLVEFSGIHSRATDLLRDALDELSRSESLEDEELIRVADPAYAACPTVARLGELTHLDLLVQLGVSGERIGYLGLGRRASGQPYTPFETDVIRAMLRMLGVAIGNVRLYGHLHRQNRELQAANEGLREIDRMKSEFLQTVNHELRTPIAVILGAIDCMPAPGGPGTGDVDFVRMIRDQAIRLREMVQNMLDFAQLTGEGVKVACVAVDLRLMLSRFVESRRSRVEKTGHSITLNACETVAPGICNESHLERAIDRLVENAVKFTPAGTHIEIVLSTLVDRQDTWVSIAVQDDGPGIREEDLQKLFRAFQQVDGSMTRRYGGLGLGLAVAKRAVELMGGRATVESTPGAGSTFYLLLRPSVPGTAQGA